MEVLAIAIHEIDKYFIHIFKKTGHDNKYVKIIKNKSVFGKYILVGTKQGWEQKCYLDPAIKRKIDSWVEAHTDFILEKIEPLNNA